MDLSGNVATGAGGSGEVGDAPGPVLPVVDPCGAISLRSAPFSFFGNRGVLHRDGLLVRNAAGARWIYCATSALSDPSQLRRPGRVTELFFLDEATALAAGHRPCHRCNRPRLEAFLAAWAQAVAGAPPRSPTVDAAIAAARLDPEGRQRSYVVGDAGALPAGTMIRAPGESRPLLVRHEGVYPWSPFGYGLRRARPHGRVEVLTPEPTVAVLAAGFAAGPASPLIAGFAP